MSETTTTAGTPVSSLGAPAAVAATDTVFMLVTSGGVATAVMVPLSMALARALLLSGGTMTGPLSLAELPTLPAHAASKAYVDQQIQALGQAMAAAAAAAAQSAAQAAAAVEAARGAPDGVAALDDSGALLIGGRAALGSDKGGDLVLSATVQDTNDDFQPIAGSRVLYTDGGILKVAT